MIKKHVDDNDSAAPDPFRPFGKSDPGELKIASSYVTKAKSMIVKKLQLSDRPVFLGALAIEAKLDLARAHIIINDMIGEGTIRPVSRDEKHKFDIPWDAYCFMLTQKR